VLALEAERLFLPAEAKDLEDLFESAPVREIDLTLIGLDNLSTKIFV